MRYKWLLLAFLLMFAHSPVTLSQENAKKIKLTRHEKKVNYRLRRLAKAAKRDEARNKSLMKRGKPPRRVRQTPDEKRRKKKCRASFRKEDATTMNYFAKTMFIKATPSSLLDFHGFNLPVGVEYRFSKSMAASFEIGIPMPYRSTEGKQIKSDLKMRLDLRQYFSMRCNNRLFLGLEVFMRHQYFTQDHGYYETGYYSYSYTYAEVHKFSAGAGLMIGSSLKLSKSIYLEGYAGMGFRYLENRFTKVFGLNKNGENDGNLFADEDNVEGTSARPYFPLGIKISYLISSKKGK